MEGIRSHQYIWKESGGFNMTVEEGIIANLNKQFARVESEAMHYHNNPYLPENVHQYRVAMRRMRSLLKFIKPVIDEESYDELNELLKNQGKSLNPIRDLDVFIEKIDETAREYPGLLDNYVDVFHFLHERRLKKVKEQAGEENMAASNDMLGQVKEKIGRLSLHLEDESYVDFVKERFDKKRSQLKEEYEEAEEADYEYIHEKRKLAKQVRYTADGYRKVLPKKKAQKASKLAEEIQEEFGVVTDAHVHAAILEKYRDEAEDEDLKEAFEKLLEHHAGRTEFE